MAIQHTFIFVMVLLFQIPTLTEQSIQCKKDENCQCINDEPCVLNCIGDDYCKGSNIELTCKSSQPCTINCIGNAACEDATIISNDATDVTLTCTGGNSVCFGSMFNCGTDQCSLECDTNSVDSCKDMHINFNEATSFVCTGNCLSYFPAPYTSNPTPSPTQNPVNPPRTSTAVFSTTITTFTTTSTATTSSSTTPSPTKNTTISTTFGTTSVSSTIYISTQRPTTFLIVADTTNKSIKPTKYETINPITTNIPTQATSTGENIAEKIAYCIVGTYFMFGILALIDSKYLRQNDYYMPQFIITATFQTLDTFLDLLFAIFISLLYHKTKDEYLLYTMIGCYLFVILPVIVSIGQLIQETRKNWLKYDHLRTWLSDYSKILYLLSILTGSAYNAVEVVNCGAFQMNVFNMGLNKKQRIQFNTKRIFGIVICENIPQLVIQIWYLVTFGVELLPIFSIIFAFITIIITILSLITQKTIIDNQQFVKISFNITGDDITSKMSRKTNDVKTKISVLLGIRENLIEIPQPQIVPKGLKIELFLFINNAYYKDLDYKFIINLAVNNGTLFDIFENCWKFDKPALISDVRFEDVISEIQQKNMVVIEANNAVESVQHIDVCDVNKLTMPSYVKNPSFSATNAGYLEVDYSDDSDEDEGNNTLNKTLK